MIDLLLCLRHCRFAATLWFIAPPRMVAMVCNRVGSEGEDTFPNLFYCHGAACSFLLGVYMSVVHCWVFEGQSGLHVLIV